MLAQSIPMWHSHQDRQHCELSAAMLPTSEFAFLRETVSESSRDLQERTGNAISNGSSSYGNAGNYQLQHL
jgi:hypothetical protein